MAGKVLRKKLNDDRNQELQVKNIKPTALLIAIGFALLSSTTAFAAAETKACEAALGITAIDFTGQSAEFVSRFKEIDRKFSSLRGFDKSTTFSDWLEMQNAIVWEVSTFIRFDYPSLSFEQIRYLLNKWPRHTSKMFSNLINEHRDALSVLEQLKAVELLIDNTETRDQATLEILKINSERVTSNDFVTAYLNLQLPAYQTELVEFDKMTPVIGKLSAGQAKTVLDNAKSAATRIGIQERLTGHLELRRLSRLDIEHLKRAFRTFRAEMKSSRGPISSKIAEIKNQIKRFMLLHENELSDDQMLDLAWAEGPMSEVFEISLESRANKNSFDDSFNLIHRYLTEQPEADETATRLLDWDSSRMAVLLVRLYRNKLTPEQLVRLLAGPEVPFSKKPASQLQLLLEMPRSFFEALHKAEAERVADAVKGPFAFDKYTMNGYSYQMGLERISWLKIRALGGVIPAEPPRYVESRAPVQAKSEPANDQKVLWKAILRNLTRRK
jgi:hypothetical protein